MLHFQLSPNQHRIDEARRGSNGAEELIHHSLWKLQPAGKAKCRHEHRSTWRARASPLAACPAKVFNRILDSKAARRQISQARM